MNATTMRTQNMIKPEDYIDKTDFDLMPHEQERAAIFFAIEQQIIKTGKPNLNYEHSGLDLNGKQKWILDSKLPLHDAQGNITGLVGINMDITERKQAENALLQKHILLQTLIDTIPDAIFAIDREGRYVVSNKAYTALANLSSPDELIEKTVYDIFPTTLAKQFNIDDEEVMSQNHPRLGLEYHMIDSSGKKKWASMTKVPFHDEERNVIGLVGISNDITERKKADALALENEHLKTQFKKEQEQNSLIQRIISTLSHDMRTPLSVISTSGDILARYSNQLTEEKQKEKLDTISHQVKFILELLDDTVQVARGRHEFHPTLVNLATLCQISIDEARTAKNTNHQLIFDNIGEIETVFIDETLISRILLNLISNAIKYSPNGGEIRLQLDQRDDLIILSVVDYGIGVSSNDLPHIFDLLYRASNVKDILGTGLGLSIVKDCVDRHQGIISVQSEVGKGSSFTVKLPV
jgi:PAS domain S-box-containing protein